MKQSQPNLTMTGTGSLARSKKKPLPSPQQSQMLNKRIVSPEKLKILVLSGNQLQNHELQFLSKCVNLIKLDLSHNNLTRVQQKYCINKLTNLRVLNLQSNKLSSVQAIETILSMDSLQVFSYKDNMLEENAKAEHLVVNSLPNLKVINYRVIFVEQREPLLAVDRTAVFISHQFQQWQPAEHSERYYLRVLKLQLQYIDNMWTFHNPVVKIQRIWRALLDELRDNNKDNHQQQHDHHQQQFNHHQLSVHGKSNIHNTTDNFNKNTQPLSIVKAYQTQSDQPIKLLSRYFMAWKQNASSIRAVKEQLKHQTYIIENQKQQNQGEEHNDQSQKIVNLHNNQYLTYQLQQYYLTKRNMKIKHLYLQYLEKIRRKLYLRKMAELFKRSLYRKALVFQDVGTSFYTLSGLSQTKRLYFNRAQQHLIENFLAHIVKNHNLLAQLPKCTFGIAIQYTAVRLMDADTYASKQHYTPLTYLMWPSMRAVILKKKRFPYIQRSSLIKIKSLLYIKNLNKRLTAQQKKKSNLTYTRIDKFIQHQYNEALGYFHSDNEFLMKHLIRVIYYHNIKAVQYPKIIERSQMMSLLQSYDQNLSVYTQKLLQRTTSAVKIQQQWRKYINNKRQIESIYEKLKKNRAARLIQRFVRDRKFWHRLALMRDLQRTLKMYTGKDVVMPETVYKRLEEIVGKNEGRGELYPGLTINVSGDNKLDIYTQEFHNKEVFFPTLRLMHFGTQCRKTDVCPTEKVDIYKFFHRNAETTIVECEGVKFYQFTFGSVEEAKLRIACFKLLTYRLYGCKRMLLLSRDTLHLYNDHVQVYNDYGAQCKPFITSKSSPHPNNLTINLLTNITQQSTRPYIYLNPSLQNLFTKNQLKRQQLINVEFYQKRHQNYPQKYCAVLRIVKGNQKDFSIEDKFNNISIHKMLIVEGDVQVNERKDNVRTKLARVNIVTPNVDRFSPMLGYDSLLESDILAHLNNTRRTPIQKNSQQHLTLYQIEKLAQQPQPLNNHIVITPPTEQTKRQQVTKFLQTQKEKRSIVRQRKQLDLGNVRQKRKQEKVMNMTLKSFHETERVEVLRKKTQKIKEYKRRSLSQKGDQSEFMQQGNFIMEQQLRMNLMRQRLKQADKLKEKRRSLPKSLMNTHVIRHDSQDNKSMKSTNSIRQKRMLFEGLKDTQPMEIDVKGQQSAKLQPHSRQLIDGGLTEVMNKRSYVKKRSTKIGAYMRDPSMVHGVFPEQYYPIENGKGGITFPKVG